MRAVALEVRDRHTFVPVLALRMASAEPSQRYLLRRAGFVADPSHVLLVKLVSCESRCDPHAWADRTMREAHLWIRDHLDQLADGQVVDVEFILGERAAPRPSERAEQMEGR